MKERWLRIGILAGALFAINLVGRLVVRLGSIDEVEAQQRVTLAAFLAITVVMAVLGVLWGRQRPLGPVVAELAAATVAAGAVILTIGPFVSGTTPAAVGVGDTFTAAWQYVGFAGGGAAIGLLLLIAAGRDYRSQSLLRYAEARATKPHRPVRR